MVIEQIAFENGTIWNRATIQSERGFAAPAAMDPLNGTFDADTLDGGAGNDTLNAVPAATPISSALVRAPTRSVKIPTAGATDTVRLIGLNPSDVTLGRTGNDLVVAINATGEQGTVVGHFFGTFNGIEQIVLPTRPSGTGLKLLCKPLSWGRAETTRCLGRRGRCFLGGLGNDYLQAMRVTTPTFFRLGDGQDTVADWGTSSDVDVLKFGAGILPGNVSVTGSAATTSALSIGARDSVTLGFQLSGIWGGVDQVRFADNTVWDRATLLQR